MSPLWQAGCSRKWGAQITFNAVEDDGLSASACQRISFQGLARRISCGRSIRLMRLWRGNVGGLLLPSYGVGLALRPYRTVGHQPGRLVSPALAVTRTHLHLRFPISSSLTGDKVHL